MSGFELLALGLGVAALSGGAAILLAYRLGRAEEQRSEQRSDLEVKDAQLAATSRRPGDRAELAQRLRDGGF